MKIDNRAHAYGAEPIDNAADGSSWVALFFDINAIPYSVAITPDDARYLAAQIMLALEAIDDAQDDA